MNIKRVPLLIAIFFAVHLSAQKSLLEICLEKDYEAINQYVVDLKEKKYDFVRLNESIDCLDSLNTAQKKNLLANSKFDYFINGLSMSVIDRLMTDWPARHFDLEKELLFFRKEFEAKKDWNKWFMVVQIQATNAYYRPHNPVVGARGYYLEMMEKWDLYDSPFKITASTITGNHFMGVEQDYERASTFLKRSLEIDDINESQKANLYTTLSELYFRKKDLNRALQYSNKILSFKGLDPSRYLRQLTLSGRIKRALGDLLGAEKDFQKAEDFYVKEFDLIKGSTFLGGNYCYIYGGLLAIQMSKGNLDKAKGYAEKLWTNSAIVESQGYPYYYVVETLLKYCTESNQREHFMVYYERLDALAQTGAYLPVFAKLYTEAGNYWLKNGDLDQAINNYNKALSLLGEQKKDGELEYTFTQDEPQALMALTKKIEALKAKRKNRALTLEYHKTVYQTTQQAVLLLDQVRQNITTKESKLQVLNVAPIIYEAALESVYQKYKESKKKEHLEEMYELIEKSKAILLQEALSEDHAKSFGGIPSELRHMEKDLINDIKFYKSKLHKAERLNDSLRISSFQNIIFEKNNQLDQLKSQLEQDYPKYFALKFKTEIVKVEKLQEALKKHKATFVSYFVGKRNLYVFYVEADHYSVRLEPFSNDLLPDFKKRLSSLRLEYSDASRAVKIKQEAFNKLTNLSYKLYTLLIGKELEATKTERLILSLDGLLHYIPFEALLMEQQDQGEVNFKNLPYLVNKYQVSYNYTATLWLKALDINANLKTNKDGILGMAATYSTLNSSIKEEWKFIREELGELEGAMAEVEFLKKTYGGKYWIGESATEAQFREDASSYSIIHLALHGLVDNKVSMNSGLIFTENGDTTTDNILLAYELTGLDLNTSLLVLSACSTGDGAYKKGEGVMSLGRGFMYAGASSILTTLWQINDQSSQRIMQYFYENLHQGMDKDKALQQAKLTYIESEQNIGSHPAFWAAYVLQGDLSSVSVKKPINWFTWGGVIIALALIGYFWSKKK